MASSLTLYDDAGNPVVVSGENIAVSNVDGVAGATKIGNWLEITKAGYDALVTKEPNTMYVLVN